jgi:ribonuclease P protein component
MAALPLAKSRHFVLHHLADMPSQAFKPKMHRAGWTIDQQSTAKAASSPPSVQLSTSLNPGLADLVDDSLQTPRQKALEPIWLGLVVPKRHAKRSVTRSLIKRQMRAAVFAQQQHQALPFGLWVLRLRAVFEPSVFLSAASAPLATAVRQELTSLLSQAVAPSVRGDSANCHPAPAK